ncbi:MAG: hypothetical protein ACRDJC_03635 [Thermomicrobiales bacterium]
MATVVAIEQDYDIVMQYCQEFRLAYVYTHWTLSGNPPWHTLVQCFNANAVPAVISGAIGPRKVRFITGSGHGSYDRFTGQHGVTIWDVYSNQPRGMDHKLIHLLSCKAGRDLGLFFVQHAADAFWGYTVDFKFFREANPPTPLSSDRYAKWFLGLDSVIDVGILNGYSASKFLKHMQAEFWRVYGLLIARPDGAAMASTLLDNFVHLVSPGRIWGKPRAKI